MFYIITSPVFVSGNKMVKTIRWLKSLKSWYYNHIWYTYTYMYKQYGRAIVFGHITYITSKHFTIFHVLFHVFPEISIWIVHHIIIDSMVSMVARTYLYDDETILFLCIDPCHSFVRADFPNTVQYRRGKKVNCKYICRSANSITCTMGYGCKVV